MNDLAHTECILWQLKVLLQFDTYMIEHEICPHKLIFLNNQMQIHKVDLKLNVNVCHLHLIIHEVSNNVSPTQFMSP